MCLELLDILMGLRIAAVGALLVSFVKRNGKVFVLLGTVFILLSLGIWVLR